MTDQPASSPLVVSPPFQKDTLIRGQPAQVQCVEIGGQVLSVGRGPVSIVGLEDEWYEDLKDPNAVIQALKATDSIAPDLLTFWQRMPDVEPHFPFHQEWEDIAVLPVSTYETWWNQQIKSRLRSQIRKAEKEGLIVKEVEYDDDFVKGMTAIFNEMPVRQGRPFWHYGKDVETVKRQFSRFVFRERMIGAYFQGQMIGFMMVANAGRFGLVGQILSSVEHRDRSPNNALIAKAVQICEAMALPHLIYLFWSDGSLAEFKRRCGFERVRVPRYFVPLSAKGTIALRLGAHRGLTNMLPQRVKAPLKRARGYWHQLRSR